MIIVQKPDRFKQKVDEGFRAGKTPEMIVKLMNVIAKQAKISSVIVSPVPDHYSNKYGSFIGFFVRYNGNELMRFNFLKKGSSNQFYSIDLYDLKKMMPYKTIDLLGYNVVDVVDNVADVLTGEYYNYTEGLAREDGKKKLSEMVTYLDAITQWFGENPAIRSDLDRVLKGNPNRATMRSALERVRPQFELYREQLGVRGSRNPDTAFRVNVKKYFEEQGRNASAIPSVQVVQGSPENLTSIGGAEEQAYNNLLENEHILKFKALRLYCNQIAEGNDAFKSLYIYGDGGIGKSFWVEKILSPLPNTVMITGKLSGYTGLVRKLYENREGKIVVFDDSVTSKDMSNESVASILKTALDPDPPRVVEVVRAGRNESYVERGKIYLNEEDYIEFENFKKENLREEMEFVDVTAPIDTPDKFTYNSITVFITNYKKVPQPIEDRCWILRMEFNNQQILDLIEESLQASVPDAEKSILDEAYKIVDVKLASREVLQLLRGLDIKGLVPRKLSHRVFNRLVALKQLGIKEEEFLNALIRIELGN